MYVKGFAGILVPVLIGVLIVSVMLLGSSPSTLKRFTSYNELTSFVKQGSANYYGGYQSLAAGAAPQAARESDSTSSKTSFSTTNIQVAGVDEADIVKTDGKYLYIISGNRVAILDAYPAENAKTLAEISFEGNPQELFINKDKLIVFGHSYGTFSKPSAPGIAMPEIYPYSQNAFANIYDVSDRTKPVLEKNIYAEGGYFDSRMIGDFVYFISTQPVYYRDGPEPVPLPAVAIDGTVTKIAADEIYYFDYPDSSYVYTTIMSFNTQTGETTSKTFLMGHAQTLFVSEENIYVVYPKRISQIQIFDRIVDKALLPLVPVDVQNKIKDVKETGLERLAAVGKILQDYITSLSPEKAAELMKTAEQKMASIQNEIAKEMEKTMVHKISINGNSIEYKTQGEVPGHVLNQFSMDEHDGYFRIATTTNPNTWGGGFVGSSSFAVQTTATAIGEISSVPPSGGSSVAADKPVSDIQENATPIPETPIVIEQPVMPRRQPQSQNHVYILDSNLRISGKVEDLAPGERIFSVRFIGNKGYVVTFRQIDPLFVIDLTPANPKVLGQLKIPGVSDYLHPYDENHIIGVGRDATETGRMGGLKLSLFNVTDVSAPKEVSKYVIGEAGSYSEALHDHKAFMFSKAKNLLVLPVSLVEDQIYYRSWKGAFVFSLDLSNGFQLKGRITHAENGTDYYQPQIRRSLYIDNVLYTVSESIVKMNSLGDLKEINAVKLPQNAEYPVKGGAVPLAEPARG